VACSRAFSARNRADSDSSAASARRPGLDACNAAIAPSLATLRTVMIVERSTPASNAACWVVSPPASTFNQSSYFCSADKNRFRFLDRTSGSDTSAPFAHAQTPSQMRSDSQRISSREVRRNGTRILNQAVLALQLAGASLRAVPGRRREREAAVDGVERASVAEARP
jgi:hypothetical protein